MTNIDTAHPPTAPRRSLPRRFVFAVARLGIILLLTGLLVESCFRFLEGRERKLSYYEGEGGLWIDDARWGWKPAPGAFRMGTPEFQVTGDVNAMFMNDAPVDAVADAGKTRVLALGDSHTFATGVSSDQTWPKVLEKRLNSAGPGAFRVYNAATTGYNLHQHLLRLRDQGPRLKPHCVVLGLSYATDLYDLLPPDHGGWIYGGDRSRDYFDLDSNGKLVERRWEKPAAGAPPAAAPAAASQRIRQALDRFATFRFLRRSKLALAIGSRISVGGQSLWPNMEIIVEKEVPPQHQYQFRLFEALLLGIRDECRRQGATLLVVGIPYLPQIYDDLWNATFGRDPRFSRTAAIERVGAFCAANGIAYADTLDAFRARHRESGRWLHHRKDAHPTPAGQEVIAEVVIGKKFIVPRSP